MSPIDPRIPLSGASIRPALESPDSSAEPAQVTAQRAAPTAQDDLVTRGDPRLQLDVPAKGVTGLQTTPDAVVETRNRLSQRKTAEVFNRFVKFMLPELDRITKSAAENLIKEIKVAAYQLNAKGHSLMTKGEYVDLCVIADRLREFGRDKGIEVGAEEYLDDLIAGVRSQHGFAEVVVRRDG